MQRLASLLVYLLVVAAAPATADPPGGMLGSRYGITGTNPDGTRYRGTVDLSYDRKTDLYKVIWEVKGQTIPGVGRLSQHEGAFEAIYQGGVAIYGLRDDGGWDGLWGYDHQHLDGREVWRPAE